MPARKSYTIATKLAILREVEESSNLEQTARKHIIDRRCLQRWKRVKSLLLGAAQTTKGAKVKKIRHIGKGAAWPSLDRKVKAFVLEQRKKG